MQENKSNGKKLKNRGFLKAIAVNISKTDPNNQEKKTKAGHDERGPLERVKDPYLVKKDRGMENNL